MGQRRNRKTVPYGAWELKSTYQRNSLVAFVITALLALGAAVTLQLTAKADPSSGGGADQKEPPGSTIVDFSSHGYTIRKSTPGISESRSPGEFRNYVPPEVIPDDLDLPESEEAQESSGPEGYLNPDDGRGGANLYSGEEGAGGEGAAAADDEDFIPSHDDFVPLERVPEMIYQKEPEYPRLAHQAGLEGTVWIQSLINKEGKVDSVRVMKTSKTALLDSAATAAAWHNRYTPGIQNGRPVYCWIAYKIVFSLTKH